MAEKKAKVMIKCRGCGKEIEKKVNRLFCIKCTYKIDREIQEMRREGKEVPCDRQKIITISRGKRYEEFI